MRIVSVLAAFMLTITALAQSDPSEKFAALPKETQDMIRRAPPGTAFDIEQGKETTTYTVSSQGIGVNENGTTVALKDLETGAPLLTIPGASASGGDSKVRGLSASVAASQWLRWVIGIIGVLVIVWGIWIGQFVFPLTWTARRTINCIIAGAVLILVAILWEWLILVLLGAVLVLVALHLYETNAGASALAAAQKKGADALSGLQKQYDDLQAAFKSSINRIDAMKMVEPNLAPLMDKAGEQAKQQLTPLAETIIKAEGIK